MPHAQARANVLPIGRGPSISSWVSSQAAKSSRQHVPIDRRLQKRLSYLKHEIVPVHETRAQEVQVHSEMAQQVMLPPAFSSRRTGLPPTERERAIDTVLKTPNTRGAEHTTKMSALQQHGKTPSPPLPSPPLSPPLFPLSPERLEELVRQIRQRLGLARYAH